MRNGEVSFWWSALGGLPPRRAPLPGPIEADVAIAGGGYTGLWTAWYLKQADPSLRVVVLERESAGFGASGRNGGGVSRPPGRPPRGGGGPPPGGGGGGPPPGGVRPGARGGGRGGRR